MLNILTSRCNIPKCKIELSDKYIPKQPKENYYGNREYKYKMTNIDSSKLEKRATQCLFRITEGNGNACYFIGLDDNGNILGINMDDLIETLNNLLMIIDKLDATLTKLKIYNLTYNKYYMFIKINKDIDYFY